MTSRDHDLVVVGAGFVGCDVAWRMAHAGWHVDLVTTSLDTVYASAKDVAVAGGDDGGFASAVASFMNVARGGQVRAWDLHAAAKYVLEATPNLHLVQSNVSAVRWAESGGASGVDTWEGVPRRAQVVVLAVGTFLRARHRRGDALEHAGRPGEMAYDDLADDLTQHGVGCRTDRDEGVLEGGLPWNLAYDVLTSGRAGGDRCAHDGCLGLDVGVYAAGRCVGTGPDVDALERAVTATVARLTAARKARSPL